MSTENQNAPSGADPSAEARTSPSQPSPHATRGGWEGWRTWTAEDQERIDIRECTDARCMNVDVNVGYQGLVDGSVLSQSAAVGDELRAAWKTKLQGEGKLNPASKSLRDSVLGPSEPTP